VCCSGLGRDRCTRPQQTPMPSLARDSRSGRDRGPRQPPVPRLCSLPPALLQLLSQSRLVHPVAQPPTAAPGSLRRPATLVARGRTALRPARRGAPGPGLDRSPEAEQVMAPVLAACVRCASRPSVAAAHRPPAASRACRCSACGDCDADVPRRDPAPSPARAAEGGGSLVGVCVARCLWSLSVLLLARVLFGVAGVGGCGCVLGWDRRVCGFSFSVSVSVSVFFFFSFFSFRLLFSFSFTHSSRSRSRGSRRNAHSTTHACNTKTHTPHTLKQHVCAQRGRHGETCCEPLAAARGTRGAGGHSGTVHRGRRAVHRGVGALSPTCGSALLHQ